MHEDGKIFTFKEGLDAQTRAIITYHRPQTLASCIETVQNFFFSHNLSDIPSNGTPMDLDKQLNTSSSSRHTSRTRLNNLHPGW